jgi:hypothetical protein
MARRMVLVLGMGSRVRIQMFSETKDIKNTLENAFD